MEISMEDEYIESKRFADRNSCHYTHILYDKRVRYLVKDHRYLFDDYQVLYIYKPFHSLETKYKVIAIKLFLSLID